MQGTAHCASRQIPVLEPVFAATVVLEGRSDGGASRSFATATVMDTLGGLLTALHCVSGRGTLLIHLAPAGEAESETLLVEATMVASLREYDLAYLRLLDPMALPVPQPPPFRSSVDRDPPPIGTPIYAVGNPLGQTLIASSGIVAAHADSSAPPGSTKSHLLVDALIAPGSSGGPVITADGRWLGMIVGKAVVEDHLLDLGLVVPADVILPFLDSAARQRLRGPPPWAGIEVTTMNAAMASLLATPAVGGVVVTQVVAGSPGNIAGLAAMDVITAVDGQLVRSAEEFASIIASHAPREEVHVSVSTDGHARILSLALMPPPTDSATAVTVSGEAAAVHASLADLLPLGLSVAAINSAGGELLVATDVATGGPAQRAGIERGDLIDLVGRHPASIASLRAEIRRGNATSRALLLRLRRQQGARIVAIEW
jgi:serine protease Do